MSLSPRDMWQCWGHFWLTQIEGVLLASRGQRMLVIVVRCTGQLIIRDAVEKPCCGLLVLATVSVISLIASLPISNSGFPIHCGLGIWLIKLASETGWGPGPFAAVLQSCTWTHLSWSNEIQRNCMGLKITPCTLSWGKFWIQKIQRDQKTQRPLLRSLEQKTGCQEQKQGTEHVPCTQQHQRGGQNI